MERGCRNCMWLYHMVTYNPTAPCSECLDYDKWQTAQRTNADRFRAMTDEELAELFEMIPHSGNPRTYTIDGFCLDDGLRTKWQWLNWLKQEAK